MPRYKGLEGFLKAKGFAVAYEYGNFGDFEVFCENKQVYSKQATGRYPSPPEVLQAIENLGK